MPSNGSNCITNRLRGNLENPLMLQAKKSLLVKLQAPASKIAKK